MVLGGCEENMKVSDMSLSETANGVLHLVWAQYLWTKSFGVAYKQKVPF